VKSEPALVKSMLRPEALGFLYGLPPVSSQAFCPMQNRPLWLMVGQDSIPVDFKKMSLFTPYKSPFTFPKIRPLMSGENLGV